MTLWEDLSKTEQYAVTYSDVYKSIYGMRPRGDTSSWDEARWEQELNDLYDDHSRECIREAEAQQEAFESFLDLVNTVMGYMYSCTPTKAVQMIADGEGVTKRDMDCYGWEVLEHKLGLKYGVIKKWLKAQEN